jgi:hypothetical protein
MIVVVVEVAEEVDSVTVDVAVEEAWVIENQEKVIGLVTGKVGLAAIYTG